MCVCVGGSFCVYVCGREEVLADVGDRTKFYGHVFNVNDFAVEHECLSG